MKNFLAMGGYAFYVWSAYSVVIAALCINVLLSRRYFKRVMQQNKDNQDAADA